MFPKIINFVGERRKARYGLIMTGSCQPCHLPGAKLLSLMKSNYSNTAQLKDLMTVPPMTAAQHAEVLRKRIAQRRMVEEAKDLKYASVGQFDKR